MLSRFRCQYRKGVLPFLVLLCILQFILLLRVHLGRSQQRQSQRISAELHTSFAGLLSDNATAEDFGMMGQKVAALGDLAELYTHNPSLDHTPLATAIVRHFPWWNPDTLSYYPWKTPTWSDTVTKTMPWLHTGVVICAGDGIALQAAHLIANLRKVLHSKLPIEIAYNGDGDLSPRYRQFLAETGSKVSFLDLTKVFDDTLIGLTGWATKPFALVASRFQRTILIDADALYLSSPDDAFERYPGLPDTGALFFHDKSVNYQERRMWVKEQIEKAGRQPSLHLNRSSLFFRGYVSEEQDSATVFVDKTRPRLYMALLFASWMNTKEVRDAVTWKRLWGDKETYWFAAELAGVPYSFEPWLTAELGELGRQVDQLDNGPGEHNVSSRVMSCSIHMGHADVNGDELFWANGGIWQDKHHEEKGFVNWTHWYLGSRIDEVIEAVDMARENDPFNPDAKVELSEEEKKRMSLATQIDWNDLDDCRQRDESRWRELSPKLRGVVQASVAEAVNINERYRQILISG